MGPTKSKTSPPRNPCVSRWFSTALHSFLFVFYAYVSHKIMDGMDKTHLTMGRKIDDPEIVRWKNGAPFYFTFWNMVLQQVYFTSCCIDNFLDLIPINGPIDLQLTARWTRRIMLASVIFPSACTVVVNFWVMYLAAPRLVFGEFIEAGPSWVNHVCHTLVLPVSLLELYVRSKSEGVWQSGTYKGLHILFALNTAYTVSAWASAAIRGCWPYPFLDDLNNGMRALFFVNVYTSSWLWFVIQRHLVTSVWGKVQETEDGSVRKLLTGKKKK